MLELRGPIGGYFVWEPRRIEPLLLVAGGSGIAPLMSMLRHRRSHAFAVSARLLYSSRTWDAVIYRDELDRLTQLPGGPKVVHTLTRGHPLGWSGYTRRVDAAMLAEVAWKPSIDPIAFICGPTPFVEAVASALVILGYRPQDVKTERFGPTGGSMDSQTSRLDGNALGGSLSEIFVEEMTAARMACRGCGQVEPLGAEHAYVQAPGAVVRCRHCEDALLVIIDGPESSLVGCTARWMEIPRPR
jgi:ferredoxin-NADP reductase